MRSPLRARRVLDPISEQKLGLLPVGVFLPWGLLLLQRKQFSQVFGELCIILMTAGKGGNRFAQCGIAKAPAKFAVGYRVAPYFDRTSTDEYGQRTPGPPARLWFRRPAELWAEPSPG